jgi:hypothetical protein
MANLIPVEQKRVAEFRKQHGTFKIGDVTVDMVTIFILIISIKNINRFKKKKKKTL